MRPCQSYDSFYWNRSGKSNLLVDLPGIEPGELNWQGLFREPARPTDGVLTKSGSIMQWGYKKTALERLILLATIPDFH